MKTVRELLNAIEAGPDGPHIGAFFNLDGTLLAAVRDAGLGGDPTQLGSAGFGSLRGQSEDLLAELSDRLFVQKTAATIRPEARELVGAHLRRGHTVAIASSATRFLIEPIAHDLGIHDVLCTRLATEEGILTGQTDGPMLRGEAKASAVRGFARGHKVRLRLSYGYASGAEDVPFLSCVGKPHAINPQPGLAMSATSQGWPVLSLREPPKPGLRSLAATAAAITGFNVGMGLGAVLGALNGDRRFGINAGIPLACDSALALAGVRLHVQGEHNLWKARPAVFVGNHQSSLDPVIIGALLRRDFTAIGKKEAQYDPRMLIGGQLLEMAFIDRSDSQSARRDVNALVDRVHVGTSVALFPEGTRSATPVVGPFKKGAFHLAMQARVPVVPIVIRNAGELMWRRSKLVNPGTVQICVLDPIPTDGWSPQNISGHVDRVREMFVATLDKWPGGEAG